MTLAPGIYKHYKGNLYEVLHTAQESESEKWVVVYRALYGERGLWVRDYEMFCEEILIENQKIKRFTFLEKAQ